MASVYSNPQNNGVHEQEYTDHYFNVTSGAECFLSCSLGLASFSIMHFQQSDVSQICFTVVKMR